MSKNYFTTLLMCILGVALIASAQSPPSFVSIYQPSIYLNGPTTLPNCLQTPCTREWVSMQRTILRTIPVTIERIFVKYATYLRITVLSCYEADVLSPLDIKSTCLQATSARTKYNAETSLAQAEYRLIVLFFPSLKSQLDIFMTSYGLGTLKNDLTATPTTAIGVGNMAFEALRSYMAIDNTNSQGTADGCQYNCANFSDSTNYEPENSVSKLFNKDAWQPARIYGASSFTHSGQTFLMPQMSKVTPTFLTSTNIRDIANSFPAPTRTWSSDRAGYKANAQEVLDAVANLTDNQKMLAEFFDFKPRSIGNIGQFIADSRYPSDFKGYVLNNFAINNVIAESMSVAWKVKRQTNTVRPFSAIREVKNNQYIQGWGGPGVGTVSMLGQDWVSYLPTSPFPEYPSGTSCLCGAVGQMGKLLTGTNTLGYSTPVVVGSSVIEPGVTPKTALTFTFATWDDVVRDCSESRIWGGVHYRQAIENSRNYCTQVATLGYCKFLFYATGITQPGC